MRQKIINLVLFISILIIVGCSVLYMSNGWYEVYCYWGIDLNSAFLFVIYHLIFLFPLILIIISSKNKIIRILGLLSMLLLIYPLMIVYSGLPFLGIRIDYSEIVIILSLIILFILLIIILAIEKKNVFVFKIYIISIIFYALITLFDKFGLLNTILSAVNITSHTSNIYVRITYLIKQDFIIYSSWVYYFVYLKDNFFVKKNVFNKSIDKYNFIWIWLFFGSLGLERLYYPKNKNITNFQLLSTSCYIPLIIYMDIALVIPLNNIILYYVLIVIFVCKIIVWVYSLVQFLQVNKDVNSE